MTLDLTEARREMLTGARSACASLAQAQAQAHAAAPNARAAFIRRFDANATAAAAAADAAVAAGAPLSALAGLAVSIKDLFDVQGQPTTAGSQVLADAAPAAADCPAVARLRQHGAALVGHTNMTEFAYSGLGLNPHHGTPANPATARLDATPRVPGGSSSGAAVSVASGAAWAALGSDTGGSIRIPAALCGLVGFKNTARLTPTDGAIPLSTTLDTACAITRSVRDAILLHEVLAARRVPLNPRPLRSLRLALPQTLMLDGLDATVSRAFERSISALRDAGAQIDDITLPELGELGTMQARGSFSHAESWAWHRPLLETCEGRYDPRVAARIRRGESMSAADYIDLLNARREWIAGMAAAMQGYDALLSPTVPVVAPPIAPLESSDALYSEVNALLLRNPSVVNMLDGCALSLPCHADGEMPVGLMLWAGALRDDALLQASLMLETTLAAARG